MNRRMPATIETERLLLRPLGERDHEVLTGFYADPESTRHLGGTMDSAESWHWLLAAIGHWSVRGFGYYALDQKSAGATCGAVGVVRHFDWPEVEIGWRVFREFKGRGYATEAAIAVRDHAYGDLGLETLVSYIAPANTNSIRLAERLGAVKESTITLRGRQAEVYRHPQPIH